MALASLLVLEPSVPIDSYPRACISVFGSANKRDLQEGPLLQLPPLLRLNAYYLGGRYSQSTGPETQATQQPSMRRGTGPIDPSQGPHCQAVVVHVYGLNGQAPETVTKPRFGQLSRRMDSSHAACLAWQLSGSALCTLHSAAAVAAARRGGY
ncbi:hypothetical protein BO71DRAFT_405502 [Aspergillus ellipticus CBS 707.79]|uniref:Uncharacterized protein n=1 Tax=Aspergillus ellipticus CBS 707.79 TaxID=1448320 RepID=A0A319DNC4_9EURO|nr:hypothetical protein BO71DRAFT_405502 [Aspergillus ellipticus CBS 707.79]